MDLSILRTVLADLGVEAIEADRAFDRVPPTGWLPAVDFVCAVFSADAGWETPPVVYLEIGQAVGAAVPVLLIAEPRRRLDAALLPLRAVQVALANRVALSGQIALFLQSVGHRPTLPAPASAVDSQELASALDELLGLRSADVQWQTVPRRLEEIALRLLRAAGADAEPTTGTEGIGDFAAWVPGTERFIPGPLLVEIKALRKPHIERATLDQLQLSAHTRDAQWSLLLYYKQDRDWHVRIPRDGTWPMVMVFDIEDLASHLRQRSLAEILNNTRNAIVHGIGPR